MRIKRDMVVWLKVVMVVVLAVVLFFDGDMGVRKILIKGEGGLVCKPEILFQHDNFLFSQIWSHFIVIILLEAICVVLHQISPILSQL